MEVHVLTRQLWNAFSRTTALLLATDGLVWRKRHGERVLLGYGSVLRASEIRTGARGVESSNVRCWRAWSLLLGFTLGLGVGLCGASRVWGGEDPPDFATQVWPILEGRCLACHGELRQEGDLRLDRRGSAFGPAGSGLAAVVPGHLEKSELWERVQGEEPSMPAEGPALRPEELEVLRRWIESGADWPEGVGASDEGKGTQTWWAIEPWEGRELPRGATEWGETPIDRYVEAELTKRGLKPSGEADRRTLIRRLALDLLGLPPSSEEVEAFEADRSPDAYARLVDRYLASPRFGERWGRHWLDVVRFAETTGFETNVDRPTAYRYRDWVIDAFNEDMPFDRFAAGQIAGDQLGMELGTGFLVAGPWDQVKSPDPKLTAMQREDEMADMVGNTAMTFMGLTLGCARCHHHKFDPLTQSDYYAMKAILVGTQHAERDVPGAMDGEFERELAEVLGAQGRLTREWMEGAEVAVVGEASGRGHRPGVDARWNVERIAPRRVRRIRMEIEGTNQAEPCLDEIEVWRVDELGRTVENVALGRAGARVVSSGDYPDMSLHRLAKVHDGEYGNESSWISNEVGRGWVEVTLPERVRVGYVTWGRDRHGRYADRLATAYRILMDGEDGTMEEVASSRDRKGMGGGLEGEQKEAWENLGRRLVALQARKGQEGRAYVGVFQAAPAVHRLYRGEPESPKEEVAPNIPAVLGQLPIDGATTEAKRRLAMAEWLGDESNRLVARVIVNRLWQHHFGRGLVATPNDFGRNGGEPSHRGLLDHMAASLVENGWSLKGLHREMVMSRTYRQASVPDEAKMRIDADNRWLWRYAPRRLEAEGVRDSILSVAGSLDLRMKGPGFSTFEPNANYVRVYTPKRRFEATDFRRMVYMTRVRMVPDSTFGCFDSPDGGLTCPIRGRSTTPLQAFQLLNSPFVVQQAERMAWVLEGMSVAGDVERIEEAYRRCLGRGPTEEELKEAEELVRRFGFPALARGLFNLNEFLFLP